MFSLAEYCSDFGHIPHVMRFSSFRCHLRIIFSLEEHCSFISFGGSFYFGSWCTVVMVVMVKDCSPYPYFRSARLHQAVVCHSLGCYRNQDGALAFLVMLCLFHRFHQNLVRDFVPLSCQDETRCNSFLWVQQYRRFRLFSRLFSCCLKKVLQII